MNNIVHDFAANTRARFTTLEFIRMVELGAFDDMKVELVDGELERVNVPMARHSSYQAMIVGLLWAVSGNRVMAEVGIDLGQDTVFGCDAALLHVAMNEHRLLRPDEILLVVEVAETTVARDLGMKRIRYASAGISTYWAVDGNARVIHVHTKPLVEDYDKVSVIRFGEPLAVPGTDATITIT